MTRREIIEKIVDDDFETIIHGEDDGLCYLRNLLEDGIAGWGTLCNEDLEKEYIQRFSPAYPETLGSHPSLVFLNFDSKLLEPQDDSV